MRRVLAAGVVLVAAALLAAGFARAQGDGRMAPVPKRCESPSVAPTTQPQLRNVVNAMRTRQRIVILVIGGTSATGRGPIAGGNFAVVEQLLESTFKSLDVQIVHRGVSGELTVDAGRRIRNEVALTGADLVLWQVGTADAMARVEIDGFRAALDDTVSWLKAHEIDVILVGLRYLRSLAKDPWYQAARRITNEVAERHGILRVSRYSAEETLAGVRRGDETALSTIEAGEASYNCTAEYLARAIAAGLFLRDRQPGDASMPRRSP